MTINSKERFALFFIAALVILAGMVRVYDFFQKPVKVPEQKIITLVPQANPVAEISTTSTEIEISQPLPNESFSVPFAVAGKARGSWFFEGSFPLKIVDEQAKVLATGYGQAQMDWMTENFVPFVGFVEFLPNEFPASGTKALLILSKDNPSGLLENAASTSVPIIIN